jgi:hypothetical protein
MTHIVGLPQSPARVAYRWTIKERRGGKWVTVFDKKNMMTNYGLTALAGAPGGGYVAPQWLLINGAMTTITSISSTQLVVPARVDLTGDTQVVIGVGPTSANQEVVSFSSVTGTGPYTYNLPSPPVNSHSAGETVTRQVLATDTLTQVADEVQYDSGNFPNQRAQTIGNFSPGTGQSTIQFFLTGAQALGILPILGLADSLTVGQGNLHNELVTGYNHTAGNDLEIDITVTLTA